VAIAEPRALAVNEQELRAKIDSGQLLEHPYELSADYRKTLVETMQIAAELELSTLPWVYSVFATCPDLSAKISVAASIQDELGHAHQMFMMLEEFGLETDEIVFNKEPREFKIFYVLQFPVRNYIEFVVAQMMIDRSGRVSTVDIEDNCSYAPYRRALKKVNFEEAFHVNHGDRWVESYWTMSPETKAKIQEYFDWFFPHGLLWFGMPDELKKRTGQITYRIRGNSNDAMRQIWLKSVVAIANKLGIPCPAHLDESSGSYVIDQPFPMLCDPEKRTWSGEQAEWADVFKQWKAGVPGYLDWLGRMQREDWGSDLWSS
jgi:ring-1,2-phenylacetyl-CoA epoxidase subunit PaaA